MLPASSSVRRFHSWKNSHLELVLQLHEQQRQTVDKAHDVGTALIQRALHPQFPHAQEVVLPGRGKVDDLGTDLLGLASGLDTRHGHAVTDVLVLLLVDLHQRLAAHVLRHALDSLGDLLVGHPGIQRLQGLGKAPRQQHLLVTRAPQGAVQPQHLIKGIHRRPPQLLLQQFGGTGLYQLIFTEFLRHNDDYSIVKRLLRLLP